MYEIKLHRLLKKMPVTITPVESLSLDTLVSDLTDYTLLNRASNADRDKTSLMRIIFRIQSFISSLAATTKRHIKGASNAAQNRHIYRYLLPQINGVSNTLYEYAKYLEANNVQYMMYRPKSVKTIPNTRLSNASNRLVWFTKKRVWSLCARKKVYRALDG